MCAHRTPTQLSPDHLPPPTSSPLGWARTDAPKQKQRQETQSTVEVPHLRLHHQRPLQGARPGVREMPRRAATGPRCRTGEPFRQKTPTSLPAPTRLLSLSSESATPKDLSLVLSAPMPGTTAASQVIIPCSLPPADSSSKRKCPPDKCHQGPKGHLNCCPSSRAPWLTGSLPHRYLHTHQTLVPTSLSLMSSQPRPQT